MVKQTKQYIRRYPESHYQGLFTRHVEIKDDGCHLWIAGKNNIGYGMFKHHDKMRTTHRLVMEWEGHDIKGKVVYHTCDNYNCVNPQHLRVGTNLDKAKIMQSKGRSGLAVRQMSYLAKCTYCNYIGNPMVMGRFHNDKCVQKP